MNAIGIAAHVRAGTRAASPQEEADAFLSQFVEGWLPLKTAANEGDWVASTDVSEAHTTAQVSKNIELNRCVGAPEVIKTVQRLLKHKTRHNDCGTSGTKSHEPWALTTSSRFRLLIMG